MSKAIRSMATALDGPMASGETPPGPGARV